MTSCPCGSEREYQDCCGRYIDAREKAPTAESLMRSRYAAYTLTAPMTSSTSTASVAFS